MKITITTDDGILLDVLEDEDIFGPKENKYSYDKADIDLINHMIKLARIHEIKLEGEKIS